MKRIFTIFLFIFLGSTVWGQLANHIVIAEVYGGGGNSGSYYKNDFILLYNPTASAVDISSWSVQYASSTGSTWQVTNLSGSIIAGGYYLIQEAQGSGGTADLPTPNVIGTIAMSASNGKVALVNSTLALSVTNPSGDASVVDFVGYGSANGFETAAAPALSNTNSARRKDDSGNSNASGYTGNGSGWDSNNNSLDFETSTLSSTNPTKGDESLPVELTSFRGIAQNNTVNLNWKTATEVDNYGFEVERATVASSTSATVWQKIAFVDGAGNSNSVKEYSYIDAAVQNGKYTYRLKQVDVDGQFKYSNKIEVEVGTPAKYSLEQNYPNPFNPSTVISYQIQENVMVNLTVYDVLGNEVANLVNANQEAGKHQVTFNSANLSSGIYFYKLSAGNFTAIKKLMLLK